MDAQVEKNNLQEQLKRFLSCGNSYSGYPENVSGNFRIHTEKGGSHIVFGSECSFGSTEIYLPDGGASITFGKKSLSRGIFRVGAGSSVSIGPRTRMNFPCDYDAREGCFIKVGKNCLFAEVSFRTCDMHSIIDLDSKTRLNPSKSILIEDHVWIAKNVSIQKGVMIGTDSIIASNSLVTKSVPPNCLAGGVPAKIIRERVTWSRRLEACNSLPPTPYEGLLLSEGVVAP